MTPRQALINAVDAINAARAPALPPFIVIIGRRDGPHLRVDIRKRPWTDDMAGMVDDLRRHGGMP